MHYISPTVPTKLEPKGSEANYGKLENFNRLGLLTIPIDNIQKLSGGNKKQVEEGYELVKLGIELFNGEFLKAPAIQKFSQTSRKLKARILERSNSLARTSSICTLHK